MRQTSKEYFRTTLILFYALAAGMLIFCGITLVLILTDTFPLADQGLRKLFMIMVTLFAVGGYIAGNMVFKKKLQAIKAMKKLTEKMPFYRGALILKYAIFEGVAFLAIMMSFVTGDIIFLGVAALIIAFFLTLKPTKARAIKDLELDYNEQQLIENPDAIIADI